MGSKPRTILRLAPIVLGPVLGAPLVSGDEVLLRGGGRVSGVIVERTPEAVVVDAGPGRVTIATSRVERIVEGRSPLQAFQERAGSLEPRDTTGWAALARWAAEEGLLTQSREAWHRVLAADPGNYEANGAVGRVELNGTWMSAEEGYRARGLVPYDGRWVSPAEHEALVRERMAEQASELERREADLRAREAEARAREAEARAQEAEAAAQTEGDGGIPLWVGYGGGPYVGRPIGRRSHGAGRPQHPPVVRPTPSSTPPSSIGPSSSSTRPSAAAARPTPQPGGAVTRRP
ncbi:MAG TPA: hypothetical protein VMT70_21870 [Vicinamibacteria bacterium]|nr:hypothetical protein [Vicinamibacteria bacterium]